MRIPGFILKNIMKVYLHEHFLEFYFIIPAMNTNQTLRFTLKQLELGVENQPLFSMIIYPHDFHIIYNGTIYPNHEIDQILDKYTQQGDIYSIIVPNRANIGFGKYKFYIETQDTSVKVRFKFQVLPPLYPIKIPTSSSQLGSIPVQETPTNINFDFNTQRICPKCGSAIKIEHNFCKYCGQDLGDVEPIGKADAISKNLAVSALTDPSPDVRKEALDTIGGFKDTRALGVLTYALKNDPDEEVRREAADELGDIHHILSMEALAGALKDPSPLVRKEALEGLKKIKQKLKSEDSDD